MLVQRQHKKQQNNSVFKGFLHRAHTICSEKYIKEEIQFLVNMFVENGHKRTFLEALVKDYTMDNSTGLTGEQSP